MSIFENTPPGTMVMSSLLWVRISDLGNNYERAKAALTLQPVDQSLFRPNEPAPPPTLLYEERDGWFGMPRAYGYGKLAHRLAIRDVRIDATGTVPFLFRGQWRDYQVAPVQGVIAGLKRQPNGGCLKAGCGAGKTIMALGIMAELKAPTLVIVHNTGLRSQWEESAQEFLGLRPHEIGRVQQDECDYRGKRLVTAITQSLTARQYGYPEEFYRWPSFVIYDEVHRAAAPTFSWWMSHFPAKYRLGLSATVDKRNDGREDVYFWHLGGIIAVSGRDEIKPKVFQYLLPPLCPEYRRRNGEPIIAKMVSHLAGTASSDESSRAVPAPNPQSIARSTIMAEEIVKALKVGRKVIVLSDRIPLLHDLERRVRQGWNGGTVDYYVGGKTVQQLEIAKLSNLILGTYAMASEGLDIADLDTLVLATPKSNVEQSVGRIMRSLPGKKTPFVLDFVDTVSVFTRMASRRLSWYRSQGYETASVERRVTRAVI